MRIGTCLGGGPGGGGFFLGIFEGLGSAGTWSMSSLTRLGMVTVRNVKKLNRYVGFGRFFGGGNYAKKRQDLPLAGSWDSIERMDCQVDCPLFPEGEDGPNTVRDAKKSIQGFYVKGFTHMSFNIVTPICDA